MKKIEIDGRKFILKEGKEVTYGAHKEVEDLKEDAAIAMLPNTAIAEMWLAKGTDNNGEDITADGLMEKLAGGDLKKGISEARKAALAPEVEAIMLSVGLSRDEIYSMSREMVDKLAKAANDALGGLLNFTEPSTIDTT